MLIDAGADVNLETKFLETPLWLGVWKGFAEFVKLVLQHNSALDAHSNGCQVYVWKYNCLEIAFGSERLDIADLLYTAGSTTKNSCYPCTLASSLDSENPEPINTDTSHNDTTSQQKSSTLNTPSLPPSLQLRKEILDLVSSSQEMQSWCWKRYANPRSLVNLCCICLRQNLPHSLMFPKALDRLPLPSALKHKVSHVWMTV